MKMRSTFRKLFRFLGRAISVAAGLATVITFIVKGTLSEAVAKSLPIIGNIATLISKSVQPLSKLSAFGPVFLALLLLPSILILRLFAERLGLALTNRVSWSEVFFSTLGLLPFAGTWIWLYFDRVPLWASALFVASYFGTVILAVRQSRSVSNSYSPTTLKRARMVGTVIGVLILLLLVLKGALPVAALQGVHTRLEALNPLAASLPLLLCVLGLTVIVEKRLLLYSGFKPSSVFFDIVLLLPFAGTWLWLYFGRVSLWASALFAACYLGCILVGNAMSNLRPVLDIASSPPARVTDRASTPINGSPTDHRSVSADPHISIQILARAFELRGWRYTIVDSRTLVTSFDGIPMLFLFLGTVGSSFILLMAAPVRFGQLRSRNESNVTQYIEAINYNVLVLGHLEYDKRDGEVSYVASLMVAGGEMNREQLESMIREAVLCIKSIEPTISALASGSKSLQEAEAELV